MSTTMDLYEVLGVSREATVEEIRKAYKTIAMTCHPDKVRNNMNKEEQEERFKNIQHAYSILSDETQRKKYDMGDLLENFQSIDDVFEMMFGQEMMMGMGIGMGMGIPNMSTTRIFINNPATFTSYKFRDDSFKDVFVEDENDENDEDLDAGGNTTFMHGLQKILSSMSSSSTNQTQNQNQTQTKHNTYQAECLVGLKDILCGGVKTNIPYIHVKACDVCKGFRCMACHGNLSYQCKSCYGGCKVCGNAGVIHKERFIDVTFQPGVRHGEIMTITSKDNGCNADVVEVTMKHNLSDRVHIENANIVIYVDITIVELLLGFETTIHLPDSAGTKVTVRKEEYFDPTSSHDVFRGLGLSLPNKKNKNGDVFIKYRVLYPSSDDPMMVKFIHMLRNKIHRSKHPKVTVT